MKLSLILLIVICSISAFGQTSIVYFQKGIEKHNNQDFEGAIEDYTKSIRADSNNRDAYFNRGNCKHALKDYDAAMLDFNRTIELDPDFPKAYYSRATINVGIGKHLDALPDLDKVIELDPTIPNALTLRGQIRLQSGNKDGACNDFMQAKQLDDPRADKFLEEYCFNVDQVKETFMLDWPDSEDWVVGNSQENEQMSFLEIIHSYETLENWTEIGTMIAVFNLKNVPMDKAMNTMYDQAKLNSENAKLTFLEKDEDTEYPWIIFTIESPNFKNNDRPESQLYFIIQGKTALFSNFRAVRKANISKELIEKWSEFFKSGRILTR